MKGQNFFEQLKLVFVDSTQEPVFESMHNELKKDLEIARLYKQLSQARKIISAIPTTNIPPYTQQEINEWLSSVQPSKKQ